MHEGREEARTRDVASRRSLRRRLLEAKSQTREAKSQEQMITYWLAGWQEAGARACVIKCFVYSYIVCLADNAHASHVQRAHNINQVPVHIYYISYSVFVYYI